jgi:deoxyribodipyrimidine photo-lyase
MKTVIWWIRRDLRVADNPALKAAMQAADQVLPLFIRDPGLMALNAPKRIAFLNNGLISLDKQLRARGGQLYLRTGKPVEVLRGLMQESGAEVIFAEEDYTPYARKRDGEVASELPLQLQVGLTVHHPLAVLKPDGSAYTVFTPFSKAWKALPLTSRRIDEQDFRVNTPQGLATELLPEPGGGLIFAAGEEEAQKRLDLFLEQKVVDYYDGRNRLDEDGTSSLSPYFRFGMLSARAAAQAVRQKIETLPGNFQKGADTWLNELIWREFYHAILYHFPHVKRQAFNQSLKDIAWRDVPVELAAWQNGLTGYPVVDASMRQLAETGWMHNRGRMIVASFLVKDLLINWQEGERWFMQHLVDGDIAANNGGWQWTAGVGTDAAPYFRIFNPVLQAKKFDPNGEFVRRWVPELKRLPRELIHEPWLMSAEDQSQYACRVGKDYPAPIVDHREARQRTLQAFKASKALWQGEER